MQVSANFIPMAHFVSQEEKNTKEWNLRMVQSFYYSGAMNLLEGKNINEIESYANGKQPMNEFRKMYTNIARQEAVAQGIVDGTHSDESSGPKNIRTARQDDLEGIDLRPIGLLVEPLNAAIAVVQKQPLEVSATAIDILAIEKKKKDRAILKNKEKMASALADVAAKMGEEQFDIGGVENNATEYNDLPLGLDANVEGELDIYFDLFYKLRPESAFETLLEQWAYIKKLIDIRDLEIRDQFWYGVSVHRTFISDTTGLPDIDAYIHPKNVHVARGCNRRDYSDSPFIFHDIYGSVEDFYNQFGSEIENIEELVAIISGWVKGQNNNSIRLPEYDSADFWNFKFWWIYCEFKTIDVADVGTFVDSVGGMTKTLLPFSYDQNPDIHVERHFAQNTRHLYWVPGTDGIYKIGKLAGFERKKGQEYYSPYTYDIWKSQGRSAVELCISEVSMAQKAYIKLQHCIIKSKPPGVYIDLKFMRTAIEGLGEGGDYTMKSLLTLFFNHNIMIGDSTDINPQEANMMPFHVIPGGVGKEVEGYWNTIAMASRNISRLTGINDQLTGQAANPEGLVGLQKLLVNASVNTIHYVTVAIKSQYRCLFNTWAYFFMDILKHGTDAEKEAIYCLITERKANLIKDIDEVALHQYGIELEIRSHEELKDAARQAMLMAVQAGEMSAAEVLLVDRISNPKDQIAVLVLLDKKAKQRQQQAAQAQLAAMQQATAMQVQGKLQEKQLDGQNKVQGILAQGKTDAELLKLSSQLGISEDSLKNLYKNQQLQMRTAGQIEKTLASQNNQASIDAQKAFA